MTDEALGYQWIIDPSGHRWRVDGWSPVVAHLSDEDGREIGVGRSILQARFAAGAWKMAEFEGEQHG